MVQAHTDMGTQIWPAAGIALVGMLVWGKEIWPGIFFGTLFVHLFHGDPIVPFIGSAVANVVEPMVAAYFCSRRFGFHHSLDRLQDILLFVGGAGIVSTLVGALIGVSWIGISGFQHVGFFYLIQYWAGDSLGVLLAAPAILVFTTPNRIKKFAAKNINLVEWLFTAPLIVSSILFFAAAKGSVRLYFFFPLVIWAALRLGQRGATLITIFVAAIVVWQSALGSERFGFPRYSASGEFYLFLFVAALQVTGLAVAGVVMERENEREEKEALMRRSQADLEAINEKLAQAILVRDEFLSIASHELKTPMTPLKLSLQRMGRIAQDCQSLDESKDVFLKNLKASERSLERLARLTNELLDVTRIRAGRISLFPKKTDLSLLVQDTVAQYKQQLEKAKCSISLHLDPSLIGTWDTLRIEEVLVNLLSNAIKFGSGNPIEIWTQRVNQTARFIIRDHGIGIPVADQVRLFQRFERAAQSRNYGGLGLGLYITRKIVEAHGGSISLASEPGKGSTFTVEIPIAQEASLDSPELLLTA
jgi:signal transduction histidine kinase